MRLRLANRIFISISGILILSIVSSTIIGAILISNATNSEAISRVNMGLKEARAYLDEQLDSLMVTAQILAEGLEGKLELPVTPDIAEKFPTGLPAALAQAGIRGRQRQAGILSLSAEAVASLNVEPDELKPLPRCPGGNLMCLFAVDQGHTGPAFTAIILNGNFGFVTTLQENLFGRALYGNKPFGTVTVFCKDTRVATTVIGPEGRIAIGTRVSDVVREKTLIKGERWLDRAFVVDEWYISAYEPIRNPLGENIGILYVGVLEKKYLDIRREAILILSLVTLPALGLLLIGAFILARGIVRPLSNLALAAGKITRGQWDIEIPPETGDREISLLGRSFREMINVVEEREVRLKQQNIDLEKANQDYQELLSFVTHELNNSIGSLLLNISMLADDSFGSLNAEQRDITDLVLRDIERFRDMVKNYLNLSRLEKGTLRYNPAFINVRSQVVDPVLQRLQRWIEHYKIDIQWSWEGDAVVYGDTDLLSICYSNLIVNALKYGKDWIRFSAIRENGGWRLGVSNGGPPIPKEKIPLLFKKFSRLVKSDDGAGLGLYLIREIVSRHGGEVWCESDSEEGTRFFMKLAGREETP